MPGCHSRKLTRTRVGKIRLSELFGDDFVVEPFSSFGN